MKKMISGLVAVVLILTGVQVVSARSLGHLVTQETQAKLGLNFSLSAVKESKEAILVRLVAPRKGKLQSLTHVRLSIRDGHKILLLSPLEAKVEGDSVVTGFQISPDLIDRSYIELVTETGRSETFFMVKIKDYVLKKT